MIALLLSCTDGKAPPPHDTSEGDTATTSYDSADSAPPLDADGDGYDETADCDDANAEVHPRATELCNGTDDDCDGEVDEGDLYPDADGDGYGDAAATGTVCAADGLVTHGEDCDDTSGTVHPDAAEVCGWEDTNCDEDLLCDVETEALWAFQEQDLGAEHNDGDSASFGDVDGDGLADVLLGGGGGQFTDTWTEVGEGQIHVVLSDAARGPSTLELSTQSDWTLVGDDGDRLGGGYYTVDGARFISDHTGDGLPEIFVGAPGGDHAWLITGASLLAAPSFANISSVADQELTDPTSTSGYTGKTVSDAGDMDGDGALDLAVGTHDGVWVVPFELGSSARELDEGALIRGAGSESSPFGNVVVQAGDVDGDGLDDLLVGDYHESTGGEGAGAAYLFLGGTLVWGATTQAADADLTIIGEYRTYVGAAVGAGSDVDGDGRDDWVLGAKGEEAEDGAAWLIYDSGDRLGSTATLADISVAIHGLSPGFFSFGDFDGDRAPDLAMQAAYRSHPEVYVLRNADVPRSGVVEAADLAQIFHTRESEVSLYGPIRIDGDVNGDGCDDLLVTDAAWPHLGLDQGAGWVIPGCPE